jgi:hypothetical protein
MDQYSSRCGYLPFVTNDLGGFRVLPPPNTGFGASQKRDGRILGITRAEYGALRATFVLGQ